MTADMTLMGSSDGSDSRNQGGVGIRMLNRRLVSRSSHQAGKKKKGPSPEKRFG